MREEAKRAYAEARAAHWAIAEQTEKLRVALGRSTDMKELADAIYALRETSALCEDLRKEADRLKQEFERQGCALWVKQGTGQPIRTEYCTGSPEVKQTPQTPKAGTPEYEAFCRHFNVAPDGFFRPHWPEMLKQLTEAQGRGEPLPPGCDPSKLWTVFKVKVLKRAPVLAEGEVPPVHDPRLLSLLAKLVRALVQSGPLDGADQETLATMRAEYQAIAYEQETLNEETEDPSAKIREPEETPF